MGQCCTRNKIAWGCRTLLSWRRRGLSPGPMQGGLTPQRRRADEGSQMGDLLMSAPRHPPHPSPPFPLFRVGSLHPSGDELMKAVTGAPLDPQVGPSCAVVWELVQLCLLLVAYARRSLVRLWTRRWVRESEIVATSPSMGGGAEWRRWGLWSAGPACCIARCLTHPPTPYNSTIRCSWTTSRANTRSCTSCEAVVQSR